MSLKLAFGEGDASYKAAGELAGITALVDDFYAVMDTEPHAAVIRACIASTSVRSVFPTFTSICESGQKSEINGFGACSAHWIGRTTRRSSKNICSPNSVFLLSGFASAAN